MNRYDCTKKGRAWLPDWVYTSDPPGSIIERNARQRNEQIQTEVFTDEFRIYRVYNSGRREWIGNYQIS